jgi:hypothetical protein
MLSAKTIIRLTTLFVLVCFLTPSKAQLNSPFSRYGLGNEILNGQNIASQGIGGLSTAFTSSMNGSYGQTVNINNPASYGSLYMTTFDLGIMYNQTTLSRGNPTGSEKMAYLIPNYLAIGIPINKVKKIGMAFGLKPLTTVNYSINEVLKLNTGDTIANNYKGEGGLNQVFIGIGKEWKHFSAGISTGYNFGRKDISTTKSIYYIPDSTFFYQSKTTNNTHYGGVFLKLGIQGDVSLAIKDNKNTKEKTEYTLTYGLDYTLDQSMKAKRDLTISNGTFTEETEIPLDTIINSADNEGTIKIPAFTSLGVSLHKKIIATKGSYDQWVLGFEVNMASWKDKYQYYGSQDPLSNSYMFRTGIQYNPDPFAFDSYWSTVVYRAGFFTGKDYINIDNNGLKVTGFTLGMGLPVRKYRSYDYQFSLLNLAMQIGQRGTSVNNFKESFMQLTVGYALSDIWFNKRKYD